jgi:hypothetical protein
MAKWRTTVRDGKKHTELIGEPDVVCIHEWPAYGEGDCPYCEIEELKAEIERMAAATGIPRQWKNGKRVMVHPHLPLCVDPSPNQKEVTELEDYLDKYDGEG